MIDSVLSVYRSQGIGGVVGALGRRLLRPRGRCFADLASRIRDRHGLEIGGPSAIFRSSGLIPVYPLVAALDNCNFSGQTIWEGTLSVGDTFAFDPRKRPGRQLLAEATELSDVPSAAYDFLLASHTLEHIANPLKALHEWRRVLRDRGTLVLIVPDRAGTFDHRRPVTRLVHLVEDYERGTAEDDQTHLEEVLRLHDLDRDPDAGGRGRFEERCRQNLTVRSMHHHVFDLELATQAVERAGYRVLAHETLAPYHMVVLAESAD